MSVNRSDLPHVVMVTPGFPPEHGGVEEHTGRLAGQFTSMGMSVEVLTASRHVSKVTTSERNGAGVRTFPAWRTNIMSISPRLLLAALRAGRGADVLHVHSYHAMNAAAVLTRRRGTHVVFTPHYHGAGHSFAAKVLHVFYRWLGRVMFRSADTVICVSEAEKALVITDFPFVADRVVVIPNGVDTSALVTATPYPDEMPTIVSLGRLEPYKGVADIVRVMPQIPAPTQLVIIGEGSARASLQKLVDELGLSARVRFTGFVTTDVMHRWLRTARVLVSLSEHEAFGMVPLEAVCAGARVVLSDIPAHQEIIRDYLDKAAIAIPRNDPFALAEAIQTQLRQPGRVNAALPDWSEVALRTLEVYQRRPRRSDSPAITATVKDGHHMNSNHPEISSTRPRNSRRIGLLDAPWEGHWMALAVAPITVPTAAELRELLLQFIAKNPSLPLAGTIDAKSRRWVEIPESGRLEFVRQVVLEGDDPDPTRMSEHIDRYQPAPDSAVPRIVVGKQSICVYHSHIYGDASYMTQLVVHLALSDPTGLVSMEPRAGLGFALRVLMRQPRSSYQEWANLAVRPLRQIASHHRPTKATTARKIADPLAHPAITHVPAREGGATFADSVLTNTQLRDLTRWRNEHCKGVSLTCVLTAATHQSLTMQGVAMNPAGCYSLFDIRRYMATNSADSAIKFGNLAKSVFLEADMTDPAAIGKAMNHVIDSGRALPGLVMGALTTALRKPAHNTETVPDGPVTLSFSSMPTLPGLADIPWTGSGQQRFCGLGYPVGRLGISVFAIRLRTHTEISASFDSSVLDPQAIQRALENLAAPAVLAQLAVITSAAAAATHGHNNHRATR